MKIAVTGSSGRIGRYVVRELSSADLGIKRVVAASSNQVYGLAGAPPLYAPVDEAHPLRPVNCYALSKMAGEQAADYFCRNFNIEILSFRITRYADTGRTSRGYRADRGRSRKQWAATVDAHRRARCGPGLPPGDRSGRGGAGAVQYRRAAGSAGCADAGVGRAVFWRSHADARRARGFCLAAEL